MHKKYIGNNYYIIIIQHIDILMNLIFLLIPKYSNAIQGYLRI